MLYFCEKIHFTRIIGSEFACDYNKSNIFLRKTKDLSQGFFGMVTLTIQPEFYLFKVNNRNNKITRARSQMCLKLTFDSHLPRKYVFLLQWQPLKNDEKCFLFHPKSFFRSQDIKIFVLSFLSSGKDGLIRNISLIWKFVTSQPFQQTITVHILPNISRSKNSQTINIFLRKSCRNWGRETSFSHLFIFKKALDEYKLYSKWSVA